MDEDEIEFEEQSLENNEVSDSDVSDSENLQEDEEPQFEMSPEDATNLDGSGDLSPTKFNRKKMLMAIMIGISSIVLIAMISSATKSSKNIAEEEIENFEDPRSQRDFLAALHNNAVNQQLQKAREEEIERAAAEGREPDIEEELPLIPEVSFIREPVQPRNPPPPSGGGGGGGGSGVANPPPRNPDTDYVYEENRPDPKRSSIVPQVQGSLWSSQITSQTTSSQTSGFYQPSQNTPSQQFPQTNTAAAFGNNNAALQFNQNDNSLSVPPYNEGFYSGEFIGENSVWAGTIISGVLQTAINTDLPGKVLARISQNVYDSKTGLVLLIPQGSLLIADYGSSISYAQSRIQIIWNVLIRPDGFYVELDGAPGIDPEGMSGLRADYKENWFEYAKAAGIIGMFSLANSKMTEQMAKYADESLAGAVATSNAQVMNQMGGNIISRALEIQPTLTIGNGEIINIILNKNLHLPPMPNPPVRQKYNVKR